MSPTNHRLRHPSHAQPLAIDAAITIKRLQLSHLLNDNNDSSINNQFRLVLGCGPGRSGTKSLSTLLSLQNNVIQSAHEMIVPRVFRRDSSSGRIDVTQRLTRAVAVDGTCKSSKTTRTSKKGSWGADRRLEWDAPPLSRGARPPRRSEEEEARYRMLRLWEQREVFRSWMMDDDDDDDTTMNDATTTATITTSLNVIAAVSSVGLAYIHEYIALYGSTIRIVIVVRPREEVVRSFMRKSRGRNHWQRHYRDKKRRHGNDDGKETEYVQPDKTWDGAFPNMSDEDCRPFMDNDDKQRVMTDDDHGFRYCRPDKVAALRAYWELYNDVAQELTERYPKNVRMFDMTTILSDIVVQRDMLRWCGFDNPVVNVNLHLNKHWCEYTNSY